MFTTKNLNVLTLIAALLVSSLMGCAPKKNEKTQVRGRLSRGGGTYANINAGTYNQNKQPIAVYADQYAIQQLVQGTGEQVGFVPPQPANGQGVFMWLDGINFNAQTFNTGSIHVEVWDDLAGQIGSDGQPTPPFVFRVAPGQEGFQGVQGQNFGGQFTITFMSTYTQFTLQGYRQGNQVQGTITFSNPYAQNVMLGQFSGTAP